MAYITYSDIRKLTDLTSSDISDNDITSLIAYSIAELNSHINITVRNEKISYISRYYQNKIDGENKTFYLRCVVGGWYIGDFNNNGEIDVGDITVKEFTQNNEIIKHNISSIDDSECKFVLENAPSIGSVLYATYKKAPVSENSSNCDILVKNACAYLTASLCYSKIQAREFKNVKLGDLSVMYKPLASDNYYEKYKRVLSELLQRSAIKIEIESKYEFV